MTSSILALSENLLRFEAGIVLQVKAYGVGNKVAEAQA